MQAPNDRRAYLTTRPAPDPRRDSLVCLRARIPATGAVGAAAISLRYVPDRLILTPHGWRAYVEEALGRVAFPSVEELATAALDDLANELVPRWLEVHIATLSVDDAGHEVMVEDRQPTWSNPTLFARLRLP